MTGTMLKNLRMFANLCGQEAMPNVIVATTMWSEVKKGKGELREQELERIFWKSMVADGCKIERFEDSYNSAWRIIGSLAENDRAPALLALKVGDPDLRLSETQQAPIILGKEEKLIKDRKDAASGLGEQARTESSQLAVYQRPADFEHQIFEEDDLGEMKKHLSRRAPSYFRRRGSVSSFTTRVLSS
jgi:hypothetical protein